MTGHTLHLYRCPSLSRLVVIFLLPVNVMLSLVLFASGIVGYCVICMYNGVYVYCYEKIMEVMNKHQGTHGYHIPGQVRTRCLARVHTFIGCSLNGHCILLKNSDEHRFCC